MKYHQIIATLTSEPLLVVPSTANALVELFRQHATLSANDFQALREGKGSCGEKVELEQMEIRDGIAYIPISGPIGRGLSAFEKGAGAVDVADISLEIEEAEGNDEVIGIIFVMDTPGGMVSGTPELADEIAAIEKPCYAYTEGMIASAGYWLAAATDGIFARKSADIGSIGVYLPWADVTEALKQKGVKVELFTSGKYKGMGFPGTSLSEEQRALLAGRVEEIAQMFYEHVRSTRPDVTEEEMQGQVFKADQASEKGLINGVVRGIEEVEQMIRGFEV